MAASVGEDTDARADIEIGVAVAVVAIGVYAVWGPNRFAVALWLASLSALAIRTWLLGPRGPRLARADVLAMVAIVVVATPLYLRDVGDLPQQVNSDEVSVSLAMRRYATEPGVDPFGVSDYLGHAYGALWLYGEIADRVGSVDLVTVRSINAVAGAAVLLACYLLVRQLLPRRWALVAVVVVGANHAFYTFSRMAVRENSVPLVAALGLALLLRAVRHGHPGSGFLGGVVLGLGFYTYFPSRVLVVLWFALLLGLWVLRRRDVDLRRLRSAAAWSALGFALTAAPIVIAMAEESRANPESNDLTRQAILLYDDAREIQRDGVFADSVAEGWLINVRDGLTTFGNGIADRSNLYINAGHGFVDPLTAALLWLGVVVTASRLWRHEELWSWLPFGCFVALWIVYATLVNKAPNYPRLLVTLPFVGYLVAVGLRELARLAARAHRHLGGAVALAAVAAVAVLNAGVVEDQREDGERFGDDIGSTGRLVQDLRDVPGMSFAIATSEREPYFIFALPWMIEERLRFFADGHAAVLPPVDPARLRSFDAPRPFALFMTDDAWAEAGPALEARYPGAEVHDVMPDGSRVVLVESTTGEALDD